MGWNERYAQFTRVALGTAVPSDFRQMKVHSIYPEDSRWFRQCAEALFKVECDYAQELINDLRRRNMPGAFVEFGVFTGNWISLLYTMAERAGLGNREIWGFGSFKGLSSPPPTYDNPFWKEGMYAASRVQGEEKLHLAERPRIKLIEGGFLREPAGARGFPPWQRGLRPNRLRYPTVGHGMPGVSLVGPGARGCACVR
jgi:hypothetical protein